VVQTIHNFPLCASLVSQPAKLITVTVTAPQKPRMQKKL